MRIGQMKRIFSILVCFVALSSVYASAPLNRKADRMQDSVSKVVVKDGDKVLRNKMSLSAYPVQLRLVGSAVCVQSPERQILPIYNETGAFYLIMRLNKGTNWINGLPTGRYFINKKLISIQ